MSASVFLISVKSGQENLRYCLDSKRLSSYHVCQIKKAVTLSLSHLKESNFPGCPSKLLINLQARVLVYSYDLVDFVHIDFKRIKFPCTKYLLFDCYDLVDFVSFKNCQ